MNNKQTKLMWLGIAVLVGMIAYPPWVSKWTRPAKPQAIIAYTTCYAPIWDYNVDRGMDKPIYDPFKESPIVFLVERSSVTSLNYSKLDIPKLLL